jgi:hypothetical protein
MKNSQKGFIVPLLIAIIAVLAIGSGVYIYEQNKPTTFSGNNTVDNNQIKQNATSTPVINSKTNQSANNQENVTIPTGRKMVFGRVQDDNSYSEPFFKAKPKDCKYEFNYNVSDNEDHTTSIFAMDSSSYLNKGDPNEVTAQIGPVSGSTQCPGSFEVYKLQTLDEFYPAELTMPDGSSKDITSHIGNFTIIGQDQKTIKIVTSKLNNIYSDIAPLNKNEGWLELYNRATHARSNEEGGMPSATYLRGRYLDSSTFQVEDIFFTVG